MNADKRRGNGRTLNAADNFRVAGAKQAVIEIERATSHAARLPPYGKEVEAALTAGQNVNVYVLSGADAWERARKRHSDRHDVMLLPPGDDPQAYRWPAVPNGIFLHSINEPRERVFGVARAIVSCGTPMVFAVFGDGEALIIRSADWPSLRTAA